MQPDFDLRDFLPYLLNLAAEEASLGFQALYKSRYGMLRTEWRVVFHLGRYGAMTATEVCTRSRIHKTKVSRAVAKLEARRFLRRQVSKLDRRAEVLTLTDAGRAAYSDLQAQAQAYEAKLTAGFTPEEAAALRRALQRLAKL
jgi:DNA-binding MarR family transcriptional regulator